VTTYLRRREEKKGEGPRKKLGVAEEKKTEKKICEGARGEKTALYDGIKGEGGLRAGRLGGKKTGKGKGESRHLFLLWGKKDQRSSRGGGKIGSRQITRGRRSSLNGKGVLIAGRKKTRGAPAREKKKGSSSFP